MNIQQKLVQIQNKLKAPKNQYNSFGKYKYRSAEDIQEAVKPLLLEHELTLYMSDEIELIGDRFYIKATATLSDGEQTIQSTAYAREPEQVKGQAEAQTTGSSSSYARKYCLAGLMLLDDTKDEDFSNKHGKDETKDPKKLSKLTELFDNLDKPVQKAVLMRYKVKEIQELPVDLWDRAIEGMSK